MERDAVAQHGSVRGRHPLSARQEVHRGHRSRRSDVRSCAIRFAGYRAADERARGHAHRGGASSSLGDGRVGCCAATIGSRQRTCGAQEGLAGVHGLSALHASAAASGDAGRGSSDGARALAWVAAWCARLRDRIFGASHSPVVHELWVLVVAGSNPAAPTRFFVAARFE